MEVEKRLDQKSRLGVVTEVDHQINCELPVFEGRKGNQKLQFKGLQADTGRHLGGLGIRQQGMLDTLNFICVCPYEGGEVVAEWFQLILGMWVHGPSDTNFSREARNLQAHL